MSYLKSVPYELEVPRGNVPGVSSVNKFGRSTDVDTTYRDIWDVTGTPTWVAPTTARLHNIVSSSASDAAAGVGARTIQVYGLTDWDTAEVSEVITLNGVTNVPTVNSYVIIHRMKVLTKGSTSVNVGNITATAQTDATVTAQINAGQGQTQMAIYGIPSTQTAYMTHYYASANKGVSGIAVDIQLRVNPEPDTERTNFLVKHTQSLDQDGATYLRHDYNPYAAIAGPAIIKMQASSSTVNSDVSAGFDLYLVTN